MVLCKVLPYRRSVGFSQQASKKGNKKEGIVFVYYWDVFQRKKKSKQKKRKKEQKRAKKANKRKRAKKSKREEHQAVAVALAVAEIEEQKEKEHKITSILEPRSLESADLCVAGLNRAGCDLTTHAT